MNVEGDIRINGRHVAGGLARYVGYVQQHDTFIGTLKVKEHLKFQVHYPVHKTDYIHVVYLNVLQLLSARSIQSRSVLSSVSRADNSIVNLIVILIVIIDCSQKYEWVVTYLKLRGTNE